MKKLESILFDLISYQHIYMGNQNTSETKIIEKNAFQLETIETELRDYTNQEQYVYKLCLGHYLVVMRKLDDSKTNESRTNIYNLMYAKCRANKLEVCRIIDIDSLLDVKQIENHYDQKRLEYKVGNVVYPDYYDSNLQNVCSGGVHYFKRLKRAYYYRDRPHGWIGDWEEWDDDGRGLGRICYLKGGTVQRYSNNKKSTERTGPHVVVSRKGTIICQGQYKNGQKEGLWVEWYGKHLPKRQYNCKNGQYDGEMLEWSQNGKECTRIIYKNGIRQSYEVLTPTMSQTLALEHYNN